MEKTKQAVPDALHNSSRDALLRQQPMARLELKQFTSDPALGQAPAPRCKRSSGPIRKQSREQRKQYMREYMRDYRRSHPGLSTRYVKKYREHRRTEDNSP